MKCSAYRASSSELWARQGSGGGGVSLESEHDLAVMVNDFLENSSNSCGTDSRYSSDSDSSLADLRLLSHKISYFKLVMDKFESDLMSVVNSLALSINEGDLTAAAPGPCNASCIRFSLVNLLRLSGYDAGVCTSRWPGTVKVPGGDHEYIDVIYYNDTGTSERLIVDIDFRSHFEIARAVESYDRILNSLPVIYVGTLAKLEQYLQVMAEAARSSLKQNSMPLPPWRAFAYLQAKWWSPHQRRFDSDIQNLDGVISHEHHKCGGHLKNLQSLLVSDIDGERMHCGGRAEGGRRGVKGWRAKLSNRS
ncbi:Protein of unknown function (DUF506 [Striga hermonthica]|uniref:Plant-specific domain TIGR01615 family protein n=1 Tax=Striga hermonthica TaxID=68872 RepID=A0A9N7R3G8_STRHE|nr:Protein of unknown function (DUF506 [Striga hermonthica]